MSNMLSQYCDYDQFLLYYSKTPNLLVPFMKISRNKYTKWILHAMRWHFEHVKEVKFDLHSSAIIFILQINGFRIFGTQTINGEDPQTGESLWKLFCATFLHSTYLQFRLQDFNKF